ncbi:MAG: lipoyl synthase [Thermotogaceae bacterium]|nr:lipoyl synthase [Thermotogaceae bacterium]MDN5337154.1 lipoyl synthase [Thermotogaceae bacterium]
MEIGVSFATASKLGLVDFKFSRPLPTFYFMVGQRCVYDCKFCTHSRSSRANVLKLSRITWPRFPLRLVEERLKTVDRKELKRFCVQVISSKNYEAELVGTIKILSEFNVSLSISVRPKNFEEIERYFDLGVHRIGIATDTATEELFEKIKGGSWRRHIQLLIDAAKAFPGKISTHLIIGLGETERQAVEFMFFMRSLNIRVALFAFTPVKGTQLESYSSPSLESYRRIQLARFLIFEKNIEEDAILFQNEEIKGFKVEYSEEFNNAFLTSGCDHCNRPFYNESPNGIMYNVPYIDMLGKVESIRFSELFGR